MHIFFTFIYICFTLRHSSDFKTQFCNIMWLIADFECNILIVSEEFYTKYVYSSLLNTSFLLHTFFLFFGLLQTTCSTISHAFCKYTAAKMPFFLVSAYPTSMSRYMYLSHNNVLSAGFIFSLERFWKAGTVCFIYIILVTEVLIHKRGCH